LSVHDSQHDERTFSYGDFPGLLVGLALTEGGDRHEQAARDEHHHDKQPNPVGKGFNQRSGRREGVGGQVHKYVPEQTFVQR